MIKNKSLLLSCVVAAALLAACKPNLEATPGSANGLDFTRYVAVGNSLTAGYANNSLTRSGQENSYPAILAGQFARVGGPTEFKQPLLPGNMGWPAPQLVLGVKQDCTGATGLSPVPYAGTADTAGSGTHVSAQGPFNNMGIPGLRAVEMLLPGYAAFNPYAGRIFTSLSARPVDEINRLNATFFTLWLGNNDVLGYATSGGGGGLTNNITPLPLFTASYDSTLNKMTANGAKGVLINIPDITAIPFFTTIPYNGLTLDATQAAALSAAYPPSFTFTAGAGNRFVIQDTSAPGGLRQIQQGEFLLLTLPQDSLKCAGWGTLKPIPQNFVLDAAEVQNIRTATEQFNAHILQKAQEKGLAYVDVFSYLQQFSTGVRYNGVNYTTTFVTGGTFSLDGVHLTPRGYAVVANAIIRAINAQYGASIPEVDVNAYQGILFP